MDRLYITTTNATAERRIQSQLDAVQKGKRARLCETAQDAMGRAVFARKMLTGAHIPVKYLWAFEVEMWEAVNCSAYGRKSRGFAETTVVSVRFTPQGVPRVRCFRKPISAYSDKETAVRLRDDINPAEHALIVCRAVNWLVKCAAI